MFARHAAGGVLQHLAGYQAIFALPTAYVALLTTAPTDDSGAGAVEVSGAGYARVPTSAASWGAAGAPPPLIANSAAIAFPTAGASWGTIVAAALYDAASGGNLLFWDWLGNCAWQPCTVSAAAPAVIAAPAHGFTAGDSLAFTAVFGGAAPVFSQASLAGLLAAAAPLGNDTLTATNGGTAVNTSGTGNGMVRQVIPRSVPAGVFVNFAPGALALLMGSAKMPLAARGRALSAGNGALATSTGTVLGTGTGDALGTGTSGTDELGVQ